MSGRPPAPSSSSSETDSMAVLDALLKLKQQQQEMQQKGQDSSSAGSSLLSNPGVLTRNDATNSPLPRIPQAMSGLSSPFASNLGIHPSLLGLLSTMDQQQNQFFASQLAAVAQSGSAAPSLLPSSPMASLSQQIQAMQQATAGLSSTVTASSNIQPPNKSSTETPDPSAANTQQSTAASPVKSAQTMTSPSSKVKDTHSVATAPSTPAAVRQEKVEEALRSKPQRGKRRDDLSEKERMELTRTRNREHAKSTRLRKKARYQELLDSEERLVRVQETESLRQNRKANLQKFLAMREAMLNGIERSTSSSAADVVVPSQLPELVQDADTFSFEVHGQKPIPTNVSSASLQQDTDHQQEMLLRMQRWDRDIRKRFRLPSGSEGDHGASPISSFQYTLVHGLDGVAVSENGTGFARVDLELKEFRRHGTSNESEAKLALSGILTVQFAPNSSSFSSVIWTTTHYVPSFSVEFSRSVGAVGGQAENEAASPRDDPSSSSNDSMLEHQMIHPSVVSLEIKASHTDTTESQSPGPGMSI